MGGVEYVAAGTAMLFGLVLQFGLTVAAVMVGLWAYERLRGPRG